MEKVVINKKTQKELRQKLRNEATKSERILWNKLKGRQLYNLKFRRQQGIGKYVVDFYCPKLKLVIEIDGLSHYDESVYEKDIKR